jgi:hypothetical protein
MLDSLASLPDEGFERVCVLDTEDAVATAAILAG